MWTFGWRDRLALFFLLNNPSTPTAIPKTKFGTAPARAFSTIVGLTKFSGWPSEDFIKVIAATVVILRWARPNLRRNLRAQYVHLIQKYIHRMFPLIEEPGVVMHKSFGRSQKSSCCLVGEGCRHVRRTSRTLEAQKSYQARFSVFSATKCFELQNRRPEPPDNVDQLMLKAYLSIFGYQDAAS